MLMYKGYTIVLQEVPDEISLAINISNCPHHCPDCHSKYLWDDEGALPLKDNLSALLNQYGKMITCVCFMGGDRNTGELMNYARFVKSLGLKVAIYSGNNTYEAFIPYLSLIDYLKLGEYNNVKGGLNSPTTNQRFYRIENNQLIDITSRFWTKHGIEYDKIYR